MQPLLDEQFVARRRRGGTGISSDDLRLALVVVFELWSDVLTRREPVRVSAENGVVILTGTVSCWRTRGAAAAAVRAAVAGADICNALRVSADADDASPADDFDRLVAGMGAERPTRTASRGLSRLILQFALAVALAAWILLPWLIVVVGVSWIPAVQAVLGLTGVAMVIQLFDTAEPSPSRPG